MMIEIVDLEWNLILRGHAKKLHKKDSLHLVQEHVPSFHLPPTLQKNISDLFAPSVLSLLNL